MMNDLISNLNIIHASDYRFAYTVSRQITSFGQQYTQWDVRLLISWSSGRFGGEWNRLEGHIRSRDILQYHITADYFLRWVFAEESE